jgi:glycosyltransferase involved in cell wall biosynthesis
MPSAMATMTKNWIMALELANALNRLGYTVDVVDWTDASFVPAKDYNVFMGMTGNFARLLPLLRPGTRTIYWATRPEASFELEAIRQRRMALQQRRGRLMPLGEDILPLLESSDYHKADALMLIGNEVTRRSFRSPQPTFTIANPALPFKSGAETNKDFAAAGRHFLFLSSWFLLRKGLDLVLEAFARTPDLHVWICAPVLTEPAFLEEYRTELFHTPNIHTLGWVPMQSPDFDRLCELCGFIVFPSCAEGMSGSVINAMARGLVPICTPETGVDMGEYGFSIGHGTPDELAEVIAVASKIQPSELADRSARAMRSVAENHTPAAFRASVGSALQQCLT